MQNQVTVSRLQEKLEKQNHHEDVRKVFGTVTKTTDNVSEKATRNMAVTSKENNKAISNLNDKLLEILYDRGTSASFLLSPLTKINNLEHTKKIKLMRSPDSKRVKEILIK